MPLAFRLPNPPALFVGRADESRRLAAALRRGPVTVVQGEGGIGKSALVLSVLHRTFGARVGDTVYVSLRGSDPREPVALGILRALVRAAGLADYDWPELLGDAGALGATALDLAEASQRWVVLDDLHHGDGGQVEILLAQLARYARRSRWIATTRAAPEGEDLLGRVLPLGPMESTDLARLARELSPGAAAEAVERLVASAAGSPWQLLQARTRAGSERPAPGLGEGTRGFLQALSLVSVPVPLADLDRLGAGPDEPLEALERRGLVERLDQGVRVSDLARDVLPPPDGSPSWDARRGALGAALAGSTDLALALQAVRLLRDGGRPGEALAALDAAGEALLAGGYAASVHGLLDTLAGPRAEYWRLRCAVDLGDAEVLAGAHPPAETSPEHRLLWATLLLRRGAAAEAQPVAEEACAGARAAGDAALAFRAAFLAARCQLNAGDLGGGLLRLEALEPPDDRAAAQRDALAAYTLSLCNRHDEALAVAGRVVGRLAELPWPLRGQVGYNLARAFSFLGRLREARRVLDDALSVPQGSSIRFDVGRTVRFAYAVLSLDGGDLERGRVELAALEPYLGRASLLAPYVCHAEAIVALAAGDFAAFDARLARLTAAPQPRQLASEVAATALHARVLRRDLGEDDAPASLQAAGSVFGELRRLFHVQREVRAGRAGEPEARAVAAAAVHPELRILARIVLAEARLAGGDGPGALAEIAGAAAAARDHGYRIREAEARQVECAVLASLGRSGPLAEAAAALSTLASALPSARFARAASFYGALAAPSLDPAVLEALAAADAEAPDTACLARALLGGPPSPDALDRVVAAAVAARPGFRRPELVVAPAASTWQPGWGLDDAAQSLWLPDGKRVDLTHHAVQWSLLVCLADRGGRADKEQIVLSVWRERAYHPLRHDNRLQAAVRKLRLRIEDDPGAPARLVTLDDGYALGGVVRRLRADR